MRARWGGVACEIAKTFVSVEGIRGRSAAGMARSGSDAALYARYTAARAYGGPVVGGLFAARRHQDAGRHTPSGDPQAGGYSHPCRSNPSAGAQPYTGATPPAPA